MAELVIGTKKGLFVLQGSPETGFDITARAFAGEPVEFGRRDPRTGRLLASVTSPFYGPKIWWTEDPAGPWTQASGTALPEGGDDALVRIWSIVVGESEGLVYAGGDPGVLFESRDGGASWAVNQGLWDHPSRPSWDPGGGGLCIHSVVPWPGDPNRLALGISAAGIWLTDDGGASWRPSNRGIVPRYLPEEARPDARQICVHNLQRAQARPERLVMQFHGGVYRSDDAGESWVDIGAGLPSDFGFPAVVDPADPDSAFVIPMTADTDRVMPDGRLRVYETRDAGETWTARGEGLPDRDTYLTVLRQAFARAGEGQGLQLYFGATSGEVFGSGDAGATWTTVASRMPPVFSVTATA
ncbi:MAG TPA: exo-alpha-sialidase [Actinomycetota bacterium]|nr:exo-alpha-sialidase [Actinomycetota bacterium]